MYQPAFIDQLRANLSVSALVGRTIALTKAGREQKALCPFHVEQTPSFTIVDDKGFFHCFGCGAHGSIFDWIQRTENIDFPTAVARAAEIAGVPLPDPAPPAPKSSRVEWCSITPVPADAPAATFGHPKRGKPAATWAYLDAQGRLLGYVARFTIPGGGKEILPRTWCSAPGKPPSWRWRAFDAPRPIYGLDLLASRPGANVLVVEGEGKAEAARRLVGEQFVVVAWAGGSKAVAKTDWTSLYNRKAGIWADNDAPGFAAAHDVAAALDGIAAKVVCIRPPSDAPRTWDLADAEREGWDGARVLAHLSANLCEPADLIWTPAGGGPDPPLVVADDRPTEAPRLGALNGTAFKLLGYDRGMFFVWSNAARQVVPLTPSTMTKASLLQLAPLAWWETEYDGLDQKGLAAAQNAIIQGCYRAGVSDADRIRGRGVSWDAGRAVLHLGDRLIVDGVEAPLEGPGLEYRYEVAAPIGIDLSNPLSNAEASALLKVCRMLPWARPYHAVFLAGWLATAPICGGLAWRTHLWLTGQSGVGKSWALDNIVRPALGKMSSRFQGATTTEAAVRQTVGMDARPVILDEAEGKTQADHQRLLAVLGLYRQASTDDGPPIVKGSRGGTPISYRPRFQGLCSSVNVALSFNADESRFLVLPLAARVGIPEESAAAFAALKTAVTAAIGPGFAGRLLARSLSQLGTIRVNAEMLADVTSELYGSRRQGDTWGAVLAGCFSLHNHDILSREKARRWVMDNLWVDEAAAEARGAADPEHAKALAVVLDHILRIPGAGGATIERSVAELIEIAATDTADGAGDPWPSVALKTLARHGVRVIDGMLWIARSHAGLEQLFAKTSWADSWARTLLQISGSRRHEPMRFGAVVKTAIGVPLESFGPASPAASP